MERVRDKEPAGRPPVEFDAVFRAEYPALFRQALLIVGDRAAAKDVVQDVFAKAWARWRRVSVHDRPGGWLQTTVVRAALRAKSRRPIWSQLVEAPAADANVEGLSAAIVDALASLSPKQRAAFVLHIVEGLPTVEIAQLLDCSESTVRVHLHRARAALAGADLQEVDRD